MKNIKNKIVSAALTLIMAATATIPSISTAVMAAGNYGIPTGVRVQNVTVIDGGMMSNQIQGEHIDGTHCYRLHTDNGYMGPAMCIEPQNAGPRGDYGTLVQYYNPNRPFSNVTSGYSKALKNYSISQMVVGGLRWANGNGSRWAFVHALMSYVLTGNITWIGRYGEGNATGMAMQFASYLSSAGISNTATFYVWENGSLQDLITEVPGTPDEVYAYVNFNKTDGTNPLSGAVIQFTTTNGTDVSTLEIQSVTPQHQFQRLANGIQFTTTGQTVTIIGLEPGGTYVFTEITPPPTQNGVSYQMAGPITVSVDAQGNVTSSLGNSSTVTMVDTPEGEPQSLEFYKLDQTGANVVGAVIQLRPVSGSTIPSNVAWTGAAAGNAHRTAEGYIEFTTVEVANPATPQLVITGLPKTGSYVFHEASQPRGYSAALDITTGNAGSVTMIDNKPTNYPYGGIEIYKAYTPEFAEAIGTVWFYAYYNHAVDNTAFPLNHAYRNRTSYISMYNMDADGNYYPEYAGNTYQDHINRGETNPDRFFYYQPDTYFASGYLLTALQTNGGNGTIREDGLIGAPVWWNMINDGALYDQFGGADVWRQGYIDTSLNTQISYQTCRDAGLMENGEVGTTSLSWLPTGTYTIVEVWADASFSSSAEVQRYQQSLNDAGWYEVDSFSYDMGDGDHPLANNWSTTTWHRYAVDIVINEECRDLQNNIYRVNDSYADYRESTTYGAIWTFNDVTGVTLDLEKITRDADSVNDLSFELWTLGSSSARLATGTVSGATGEENHYNVSWSYTLRRAGWPAYADFAYEYGAWGLYYEETVTGRDRISSLPAGSYELREYCPNLSDYATPEGWNLVTPANGNPYFSRVITVSEEDARYHAQVNLTITNDSGSISVYKVDEETGVVLANYDGAYDATFALYEDRNNNGVLDTGDVKVAELADTDRDGLVTFELDEIYPNVRSTNWPTRYVVVETQAPYGYYLNGEAVAVDLSVEKNAEIRVADRKLPVINVYKVDEETGERLTNYAGPYTAAFALYEDNNNNGIIDSADTLVTTLHDTDRDGVVTFDFAEVYPANKKVSEIPTNFLIIETQAPYGYYLNGTAYPVDVSTNRTAEVTVSDRQLPVITVYKVDEWTGEILTSYEGPYDATFALYEDSNNNGTLDASDTLVTTLADTDKDGRVIFEFAEIYPANKKVDEIPSNFLIVETQAPYGFYLNETAYPVDISTNRTAEIRCEDTPYTATIEVIKLNGDTGAYLEDADFTVYVDVDGDGLYTAGVDTVARTFNGTAMVDATFTYNRATNRYVSSELRPGNYVVVETKLPDGFFFVDDNGVPTLNANEQYFEIENRDTSLPTFEVGTYETTEYNKRPEIFTTLTSPLTESHVAEIAEDVELVDEVYYHNLVPGVEYVMNGVLMNRQTGEPLLNRMGSPVTASTTFTPTESTGTVDVVFHVDTMYIMELIENGTINAPCELVAFEDCDFTADYEYQPDRDVAEHEDIDDEGQTVTVGQVRTSAASNDSDTSDIRSCNGLTTITDYAHYEGLAPHTTYRIYGELHLITYDENGNKVDGGAIVPRSNEVTYRWVEFTTGDSHEGEVPVNFVIDAERFRGQDIVCFEYVYQGDALIMWHADIEADEQTVHVPAIASQAFCPDTCTQVLPYDASVTVTDTIYYTNLEAGVQYEVEGSLNWVRHNADGSVDTGAVEGASAYVVFRPDEDSTDGTVTMTFVFDTRRYADMGADEIVVFEHLTHYGHLLAKDADLNNRLQTLTLPQLHTNASDVNTTSQTMPETTATQVTDRVTYTGLTVGQQYTISGCLQYVVTDMNGNDVEHGTLVQNGMPVTASVTFTPTTPNGEVTLTFNVDASELMSRHIDRVVAFERLYYGAGILLAVHEDLNNKDQTVEVCDLRTTATVDGEHVARLVSDVTLVDRIYFEGLTVGREYRVETDLMRRSTGMSIVHKTTVFTATTSEGYIDVEMHFDASGFSSSDYVVVFENGYDNATGLLIRSHQDWSDMDQTVTFRRGGNGGGTPTPTPTPWSPGIPSTGEGTNYLVLMGILFVVIGSAQLALFILRRKWESEEQEEE